MKLGMDRRDREVTIVDPMPCRDIAAARRDQQQQRHARSGPAIWSVDHGVAGETRAPMPLRGGIPEFGQHARQTLVGLVEPGIDGQRRLVLRWRAGDIAILEQQIAQVDPPDRIVRVRAAPPGRKPSARRSGGRSRPPARQFRFSAEKWVGSRRSIST